MYTNTDHPNITKSAFGNAFQNQNTGQAPKSNGFSDFSFRPRKRSWDRYLHLLQIQMKGNDTKLKYVLVLTSMSMIQ